jgi:drug/metabolite transporter (DMT)-like permease
MAIALAIAASLLFGTADFLGGFATKRARTIPVVIFSQLMGLAIACVVAGSFTPHASVHVADLAWGAAAGLAGGAGLGIFYRALGAATMGIVAAVTGVATAVVPVVVGLSLGEHPGLVPLAGVALAAVAILLVSAAITPATERSVRQLGAAIPPRALGAAIIAGCCFGTFYVLIRNAGPGAGIWPLAAARGASVSLYLVAGLVARQSLRVPRAALPVIVGAGALDMVANISFLLAAHRNGALLVVVGTLASLYPVTTIVLARIVLRERLSGLQSLGLALAGGAIVLISAG